jgi:hypothetical protein
MKSHAERFHLRLLMARVCLVILLISLVAAAWLRGQAEQNWVAGIAVVALLWMRATWRCPACSMPFPVIPRASLTACKHCHESFQKD